MRQNLGGILIRLNLDADAVVELRELETMAPESAVCHTCLGSALYNTLEFAGAKKEFQIAIRLDPSAPMAYRNLGRAEEDSRAEEALTNWP